MCDFPVTIKLDPPREMEGEIFNAFPADCGKCIPCLRKRKAQWSFRLMEEKSDSFSSYFITLTYDDKHVPYGDNGMTANKQDHKDFIKWLKYYESEKRLRQRDSISAEELERKEAGIPQEGKLKYYGIIEYGDLGGRPHLHYIIFNVIDSYNINRAWSDNVRLSKKEVKIGSPKGRIDIDPDCNQNNIDYVTGYMMKVKRGAEEFENREKELQFISKGLGIGYATGEIKKYIKREDGNQIINSRGHKLALPRYYNKKFLTEEEREAKASYTADLMRKQKIKEDVKFQRVGKDPEIARREIAVNRLEILNRRKRRELK